MLSLLLIWLATLDEERSDERRVDRIWIITASKRQSRLVCRTGGWESCGRLKGMECRKMRSGNPIKESGDSGRRFRAHRPIER